MVPVTVMVYVPGGVGEEVTAFVPLPVLLLVPAPVAPQPGRKITRPRTKSSIPVIISLRFLRREPTISTAPTMPKLPNENSLA